LMTLGLAGLTAVAGSVSADARKGGKKKHKQNNAPVPLTCPPAPEDRCPAQVNSCKTSLGAQCAGSDSCSKAIECCSLLETCNANAFWTCLLTAVN
jgi:hypothetical protein